MLNHSTDPAQRNTQLLRFSAGTPLPLEGGKTLSSKGFFTMKAGTGGMSAMGRQPCLVSACKLLGPTVLLFILLHADALSPSGMLDSGALYGRVAWQQAAKGNTRAEPVLHTTCL
jgi:hypothetical protein